MSLFGTLFRRKSKGDPILADDFNRVIDELARLGKWRVAGGLSLRVDETGFTLSLAPQRFSYPVRPTAIGSTGSGRYPAERGVWKNNTDPSQRYRPEDDADFSHPIPCYLENMAEKGRANSHRIDVGEVVDAWDKGVVASDGKPRFGINYTYKIVDFRMREDGTCIEATTQDADNPTTWICKADITTCDDQATAMASQILLSSGLTLEEAVSQHDAVAELVFERMVAFGDSPITG